MLSNNLCLANVKPSVPWYCVMVFIRMRNKHSNHICIIFQFRTLFIIHKWNHHSFQFIHGLCHFCRPFISHKQTNERRRKKISFKTFSELLQFIVINIINEFISGGESHTHKPYRETNENFLLSRISNKNEKRNGAHVATRPNASTHSFIGLIVFTTACYSIFLCVFRLSIPILFFLHFIWAILVGFLTSLLIIFTFHIVSASYIHQPQTEIQGKYKHTYSQTHSLSCAMDNRKVFC